jgi:hypothetical protein
VNFLVLYAVSASNPCKARVSVTKESSVLSGRVFATIGIGLLHVSLPSDTVLYIRSHGHFHRARAATLATLASGYFEQTFVLSAGILWNLVVGHAPLHAIMVVYGLATACAGVTTLALDRGPAVSVRLLAGGAGVEL